MESCNKELEGCIIGNKRNVTRKFKTIMVNLNIGQNVANQRDSCSNCGQILFPIGMCRYGSLINIYPSVKSWEPHTKLEKKVDAEIVLL